jgi:hypothetical protein
MSLCLACGLCCDGTLFYGVPVSEDEAKALAGRVRIDAACSQLLQGCVALGGDLRCSVYEDRPQACRRFRCTVLRALEAGQLTSEEAHAAIDEVLSVRRELADALKLDPRAAVAHVRETSGATLTDAQREVLGRLGRKLVLLQLTMS